MHQAFRIDRTRVGAAGSAVLVVAAMLAGAGRPARAQVDSTTSNEKHIVITQTGSVPKIRLLLEDFLPGAGATGEDTKAVHDVAGKDLQYSDVFAVTEIPRLTPGDTLYAGRAQALVRGELLVSGGDIVLRGTLESLPGRTLIFSRDYRTKPEWYREAAHRFADDIVLYLTGRQGIARTRIVFVSSRAGGKEIFLVDYDGFGLRQLTRNGSINLSPSFRPDGAAVVFTSYQKGDADLWQADVAGGKERPLVGGRGVQSAPAYSPDGSLIAYSQTEGRSSEIMEVTADGGDPHAVARAAGINTSPSWSPDGRRIVFTSDRAGSPQLYMMDADGTGARRLTFAGKWNDQADWSPQGDRIAFASMRGGLFRIMVMDASGLGEEKQITRGPGSDEHPRWAPDGRHVVFTSTRGGEKGIYVLDVDSGTVRALVTGRGTDNYAPDWSGVPPR